MFLTAIFNFSSLVTKWLAGNIAVDVLLCKSSPVNISNSVILSISSPKKSTRIALECSFTGIISNISPRTLKVPLLKSISFLS